MPTCLSHVYSPDLHRFVLIVGPHTNDMRRATQSISLCETYIFAGECTLHLGCDISSHL